MLFNEPKLLKFPLETDVVLITWIVSVLFNEPKLLKSDAPHVETKRFAGFSALQRAEIAEMRWLEQVMMNAAQVSVLFNEPKLLKYGARAVRVSG